MKTKKILISLTILSVLIATIIPISAVSAQTPPPPQTERITSAAKYSNGETNYIDIASCSSLASNIIWRDSYNSTGFISSNSKISYNFYDGTLIEGSTFAVSSNIYEAAQISPNSTTLNLSNLKEIKFFSNETNFEYNVVCEFLPNSINRCNNNTSRDCLILLPVGSSFFSNSWEVRLTLPENWQINFNGEIYDILILEKIDILNSNLFDSTINTEPIYKGLTGRYLFSFNTAFKYDQQKVNCQNYVSFLDFTCNGPNSNLVTEYRDFDNFKNNFNFNLSNERWQFRQSLSNNEYCFNNQGSQFASSRLNLFYPITLSPCHTELNYSYTTLNYNAYQTCETLPTAEEQAAEINRVTNILVSTLEGAEINFVWTCIDGTTNVGNTNEFFIDPERKREGDICNKKIPLLLDEANNLIYSTNFEANNPYYFNCQGKPIFYSTGNYRFYITCSIGIDLLFAGLNNDTSIYLEFGEYIIAPPNGTNDEEFFNDSGSPLIDIDRIANCWSAETLFGGFFEGFKFTLNPISFVKGLFSSGVNTVKAIALLPPQIIIMLTCTIYHLIVFQPGEITAFFKEETEGLENGGDSVIPIAYKIITLTSQLDVLPIQTTKTVKVQHPGEMPLG